MNRALIIGVGGLAAVVAAAVIVNRARDGGQSPSAVSTSVVSASAGGAQSAAPQTVAVSPAVASPATSPQAPTIAAARLASAAPQAGQAVAAADGAASAGGAQAPSFDVVRVTPTGGAVIAGRAEPNAEVTVRDGDTVVGQVTADRRGEWVLVPDQPLAPGNRSLSLSAQLPGKADAQASNGEVLVAVPQPRRAVAGQGGDGADAVPMALALLVPRAGGDIARPLQVPGQGGKSDAPAASAKGLALDIIEYDAAGRVALAGRAEPGTELNLYLDGRLIAEVSAGSDGRWSAKPADDIAPGLYQLRIDGLGRDGRVAARLALPFQRAEAGRDLAQGERFTIQPGNSLWRIARRSYGSGTRYAVIFAANRDQIADPDLIYPGQVVRLPAAN